MEKSFTDKMGYVSPFGENSSFKETSESNPKPIIKTANPIVLARINQEKQDAKEQDDLKAKGEDALKEIVLSEKELKVMYETDGHYSTVFLVCLMLGMDPESAEDLAKATEAPDTTIHSKTKFELNDTWGNFFGPQQEIHSLTGGFHGIEEFFTSVNFLYTPNGEVAELGKLLHRFGDTYAHTKINNLKPADIKGDPKIKETNELTRKKYIESWKKIAEKPLKDSVAPWIKFFNYYMEKDGLVFLEEEQTQREIFSGQTLKEVLKDIYLKNDSKDFIMYGEDGYTLDHFESDGGYPDQIYLRSEWYRIYVQNLAWLFSIKFKLNIAKLDLNTFDRMISFVLKERCSMKGIIDFEITKKLNRKEVYVPVFYSNPVRVFASADAVVMNNYLKIAEGIVGKTKKYIVEHGASVKKVEKIKSSLWLVKFNKDGFFVTEAFKITIN